LIRLVSICCLALLAGGCAGVTEKGYWGAAVDWPDGQRLAQSAVAAFRSPHTWVPLAGAVVFGISDLDEEVSEWAAREQPLFGRDAEDASDSLRNLAAGSYLLTAFIVPSDSAASRASGLAVGLSTVALERGTVAGLKAVSGRTRPDGSDDASLPSGHTSMATATAMMAASNLGYVDIADWLLHSSRVGLYGLAAATGWARVEAEKHYPSDVLAGYAIGAFIARFMEGAFLANGSEDQAIQISAAPLPGGAALTFRVVLD
jgi:membrane-associated phospholipid phosphatase